MAHSTCHSSLILELRCYPSFRDSHIFSVLGCFNPFFQGRYEDNYIRFGTSRPLATLNVWSSAGGRQKIQKHPIQYGVHRCVTDGALAVVHHLTLITTDIIGHCFAVRDEQIFGLLWNGHRLVWLPWRNVYPPCWWRGWHRKVPPDSGTWHCWRTLQDVLVFLGSLYKRKIQSGRI